MKLIFALLILLAAIPVQFSFANSLRENVVKIESSPSFWSTTSYFGSGVLLKYNSQIYVLTSEHVVIHSSGSRNHVYSPLFGNAKAQLMAADWGMGLALLRLNELDPAVVARLNIPSVESLTMNESPSEVRVLGYPFSSSHLFESNGIVLDSKSSRHEIPLLPTMIELVRAHGEYGMSGGLLTDSTGTQFVGILSHQILQMLAGRPTQVNKLSSENQDGENHLLAISAQTALAWVNSMLTSKTPMAAGFTRVLNPSDARILKVSCENFELTFEHDSSKNDKQAGSTIGGGDASGVGGGDASGVGGGDQLQTPPLKVQIQWIKSDPELPTHCPWRSNITSLLNKRMRGSRTVMVPFLLKAGRENDFPVMTFPKSAEQWISLVVNERAKPYFLFSEGETDKDNLGRASLDLNFNEIAQAGLDLEQKMKAFSPTTKPIARELFKKLATIVELSQTKDGIVLLDRTRLKQLEKDPNVWTELFDLEFEKTVQLMRSLKQMSALLGRL